MVCIKLVNRATGQDRFISLSQRLLTPFLMGLFTRERITFRKTFRNVIRPFPDMKTRFTLCVRKALSNQAFETRFEKKGDLDRDPRRKPDSRICERKALSQRDSCVCILEMHAEAMHGSISADCAVGKKYYPAVRRSRSWLGQRLQCMWTHVTSSNHDPNHETSFGTWFVPLWTQPMSYRQTHPHPLDAHWDQHTVLYIIYLPLIFVFHQGYLCYHSLPLPVKIMYCKFIIVIIDQ